VGPAEGAAILERVLYDVPWLRPDLQTACKQNSMDAIAAAHEAIPPGVIARGRVTPAVPVQVTDLIGVKDRRYLDRTRLQQHRSIVDLMRYAALNQGGDNFASYNGFIPAGAPEFVKLPDPDHAGDRYSDEQLYALALYVYSLQPPPNPNKLGALAARGQKVFNREGCAGCHTPPLYTNNKLTLAEGFTPPAGAEKAYDILPISVGTDPDLALKTRRGTGYYKRCPHLRAYGIAVCSGTAAGARRWKTGLTRGDKMTTCRPVSSLLIGRRMPSRGIHSGST